MAAFLTCDGYKVIGTAPDDADLPALCAKLETERGDGYAVLATIDGTLVADASGMWENSNDGGPPFDAATATGRYDRDF